MKADCLQVGAIDVAEALKILKLVKSNLTTEFIYNTVYVQTFDIPFMKD